MVRSWNPTERPTHLFAQYEMIEPWLDAETPAPERKRLQSPRERAALDGYYECILCFCCTSGCPQPLVER